ncbi:ribosome hibernation-promoting factor, HPF/YfiA family [Aeromonas tecta]|jgi:ribosome-associated inhibitor A|uniref:ribosome hibernation-promoting factor, HPF/YfiA family n=1 Tax=Aeromonas tecta TaxID=324617 RepID=UPI0006808BD0|nr:ribosome-associated translation inhibitor RaiA [Aeromonas tecta]
MKIEITSKIIDITPAIRERIESRFEKLERLQVPLITPHVIISKERLMYNIEATAGIPNGKLFAQAEHEDLYAAITDLGQKLERQLTRHIEKPIARRAAAAGKEIPQPEPDEADA